MKCRYKIPGTTDEQIASYESKYIIIYPTRETGKHFFISHKDSADTAICSKLRHYLKKIGFEGYLAEEHRMPGLDLWKEKIRPAIKGSAGIIVLWTANASKEPEQIIREIELAKESDKRILLVREDKLLLPELITTEIEYFPTSKDVLQVSDLVELVRSIDESYNAGLF